MYCIEKNAWGKKITFSFAYKFGNGITCQTEENEATGVCPKVWSLDLSNEIILRRTQEYSETKLEQPSSKSRVVTQKVSIHR